MTNYLWVEYLSQFACLASHWQFIQVGLKDLQNRKNKIQTESKLKKQPGNEKVIIQIVINLKIIPLG